MRSGADSICNPTRSGRSRLWVQQVHNGTVSYFSLDKWPCRHSHDWIKQDAFHVQFQRLSCSGTSWTQSKANQVRTVCCCRVLRRMAPAVEWAPPASGTCRWFNNRTTNWSSPSQGVESCNKPIPRPRIPSPVSDRSTLESNPTDRTDILWRSDLYCDRCTSLQRSSGRTSWKRKGPQWQRCLDLSRRTHFPLISPLIYSSIFWTNFFLPSFAEKLNWWLPLWT